MGGLELTAKLIRHRRSAGSLVSRARTIPATVNKGRMREVAESLEDVLLGAYEGPDEIPESEEEEAPLRERFRIRDDGQASWAVRKIAQARQELAAAEALARQQIERVERWLADRRREAERTERFFTALLMEYFIPKFAIDPRRKAVKLPSGTAQVRQQPPEFRRDDAALLKWLKEHEMTEFVETKETPRWGDLKAQVQVSGRHVVTEGGEIVEGVEVIPRPPLFRVIT